MPELLACVAFFTSKMNFSVFVFLAERFLVYVFKNHSYSIRTTRFSWPKLHGFTLDPVMPGWHLLEGICLRGTRRSWNAAFPLPLSSRGSSGGLWGRQEQLVTTFLGMPRENLQSPKDAQMSTWSSRMCPLAFILTASLVFFHTLLLSRFLPSRYLLCCWCCCNYS